MLLENVPCLEQEGKVYIKKIFIFVLNNQHIIFTLIEQSDGSMYVDKDTVEAQSKTNGDH